jgi:hypothetical protein
MEQTMNRLLQLHRYETDLPTIRYQWAEFLLTPHGRRAMEFPRETQQWNRFNDWLKAQGLKPVKFGTWRQMQKDAT